MANLTLRIEDSLLAEVRKTAAARETTVNRMIRDFLARETEMAAKKRERGKRLDDLFRSLDRCEIKTPVSALNREELHERG